MNSSTAWRFIVAAQDDPILASWAYVCQEYPLMSPSEISPYEAWTAFQGLFNHDIVSSTQYDSTDCKKHFFSGCPTNAAIQEVFARIRFLCPEHASKEREQLMPDDSFFQKDNALATRTRNQSLASPRRADPLGDAFAPSREILPKAKRDTGVGLEAFDQPQGLPCQDSNIENKSHRLTVDEDTYQPRVHCGRCGQLLTMSDDGQEILPEDGDPSSGTLLLAVFAGKCHPCGLMHHCSVAKDALSEGSFR